VHLYAKRVERFKGRGWKERLLFGVEVAARIEHPTVRSSL